MYVSGENWRNWIISDNIHHKYKKGDVYSERQCRCVVHCAAVVL